jgi:two-component system phosphate regulon sensor histidine kinase PhoR
LYILFLSKPLGFTAGALRLEQALFNLVDNALKYGANPGLRLMLSAQNDGEQIVLRVADNGPGIPLSDQPHIFERFYRVYKGRSRATGGTGLGLSIVKHAVQAHGGSVGVESSPGKGATFILRLPRAAKGWLASGRG